MALVRAEQPPRAHASPRPAARWADLRTRILSTAVMLPLALGCIWIGGAAFTALVALITIGMAFEWVRLCQAGLAPRPVLMFASVPLAVLLAAVGEPVVALGLLALITLVACIRVRGAGPSRLLPFGVPYIGLGAIALTWLRTATDHGRADVIVLLLVIWATDVGAYGVGRAFGGALLAPRISPGKTWSGAAGGLLAGVAVGASAAAILGAAQTDWRATCLAGVVAGLIGCVGQAGDLFESLLKRHFDVKDSGALIPGHGGLFDRLDAVLAAAPAAALLALALGRGVMPWQ